MQLILGVDYFKENNPPNVSCSYFLPLFLKRLHPAVKEARGCMCVFSGIGIVCIGKRRRTNTCNVGVVVMWVSRALKEKRGKKLAS